jgi:rhodanese-related sulfurtransferase
MRFSGSARREKFAFVFQCGLPGSAVKRTSAVAGYIRDHLSGKMCLGINKHGQVKQAGTVVMVTSVKQMMEAANAAVPRITPQQAREMIAKGDTLVVDVRDAPEVEMSGKVAGAVHVSRGMLEFRADPESPSHDKNFAKDKTVIVDCGSGGRAALSGKVLKDMGYERVYNLGGFKDWAESGGEVEK